MGDETFFVIFFTCIFVVISTLTYMRNQYICCDIMIVAAAFVSIVSIRPLDGLGGQVRQHPWHVRQHARAHSAHGVARCRRAAGSTGRVRPTQRCLRVPKLPCVPSGRREARRWHA